MAGSMATSTTSGKRSPTRAGCLLPSLSSPTWTSSRRPPRQSPPLPRRKLLPRRPRRTSRARGGDLEEPAREAEPKLPLLQAVVVPARRLDPRGRREAVAAPGLEAAVGGAEARAAESVRLAVAARAARSRPEVPRRVPVPGAPKAARAPAVPEVAVAVEALARDPSRPSCWLTLGCRCAAGWRRGAAWGASLRGWESAVRTARGRGGPPAPPKRDAAAAVPRGVTGRLRERGVSPRALPG
mmetsp:Transcript_63044/g.195189  ORF Transcript_63044/g.195189 Transcript_63044/m.195189 type:complete len:241 (+) Transcript_63044:419-1141(+)